MEWTFKIAENGKSEVHVGEVKVYVFQIRENKWAVATKQMETTAFWVFFLSIFNPVKRSLIDHFYTLLYYD